MDCLRVGHPCGAETMTAARASDPEVSGTARSSGFDPKAVDLAESSPALIKVTKVEIDDIVGEHLAMKTATLEVSRNCL
ncbi:MAG: hypothetical protein CMG77_00605 [Marinimicrobium sp.]|nr:hypothetical protein [Marinimicrobium sp.]